MTPKASSSRPEDQRRAARARHDSVVEILDASGNVLIGTARLVNFSNVGLCIAGTLDIRKDEAVHARVRMLREGILDVAGRVIWVRPKPAGFQYGISIDKTKSIPH